jgi:hypothetical protein
MHGVPAHLDLGHFHGAILERIDLGIHIIHFRFGAEPPGVISVEGDWELYGADGGVVDRQEEPSERGAFRLHVLIGREVVSSEVSAPDWFELSFDSGHRLRVYDRSQLYDSFSIQPGDIYV